MLSVLQAISSRVLLQLLLLYHKQRQLQQQQQQKEGNNKCLLTFYSHCVGSKRRRHTDTLVISFPRMSAYGNWLSARFLQTPNLPSPSLAVYLCILSFLLINWSIFN